LKRQALSSSEGGSGQRKGLLKRQAFQAVKERGESEKAALK
jgi:hypothetical protein